MLIYEIILTLEILVIANDCKCLDIFKFKILAEFFLIVFLKKSRHSLGYASFF